MKKTLSLLLAAAMTLSLLAGCGSKPNTPPSTSGSSSAPATSTPAPDVSKPEPAPEPEPEVNENLPDFMVMSGPTGVGAAKLISNWEVDPASASVASATVVADNEAVKNALINGDADIAAVATNMAATLYNKLEGGIQILAVNTLGVLYILEKGNSIHSMSDLRGKTLYATGQGANPEYVLNHLLTENDVDPSQVDIQWMTPQEVTAKMTTEEKAICMLPVPAATTLLNKDSGVRQALSLSDVWDLLDQGSLPQGCVVVRTDFLEQHPEQVEAFLTDYADSISFMNDKANRAEAASLLVHLNIVPNVDVAADAIYQCNLTFVTGNEMREMLQQYYQVLFQANPASIGGSMPFDSFYYGLE